MRSRYKPFHGGIHAVHGHSYNAVWAPIHSLRSGPLAPAFLNPCHARLKGDAKEVDLLAVARAPLAASTQCGLRSMHGRPRASRWNMPCLRCIQHEQATYLCAPPFRRRDMISLLFPSRSGILLFSSSCRHFSFSLFASFAQDENRSIAFLSAVSLQRPFPS